MPEYAYVFDSMSFGSETIRAERKGGISEEDARAFTMTRAPSAPVAQSARDPKNGQWINDARIDGFTFTGALWHPRPNPTRR